MPEIIYLSIKILLTIFACHVIGDYVLQNDYIAKTKGQNWWHLIVHSFLYIVPFRLTFGYNINLLFLFIFHLLVDSTKARDKSIGYVKEQIYHISYAVLTYFVFPLFWGLIK